MATELIAFYNSMNGRGSSTSVGNSFTTDAGTTLQDMVARQVAAKPARREPPPMTEIVKSWASIGGSVSAEAVSAPRGNPVKATPAVRFAMYLKTLDPQARAAAEEAARVKQAERLKKPNGRHFK
jgi:hypothetical protein